MNKRKHARRGRRPISQRAHSRGIGVHTARGRDTRVERAQEHEGRALNRGKKKLEHVANPSPGGKGESAVQRRARKARARLLFAPSRKRAP